MTDKKLKDLVSELVLKIQKIDNKSFNYELCPYFSDCNVDLDNRCICLEYKNCAYYQNYQKIKGDFK